MTQSTVSRRPVLALCLAAPLLTLGACGGDKSNASTSSSSSSGPTISDAEAATAVEDALTNSHDHIKEHYGDYGVSMLTARVVAPEYLKVLKEQAAAFEYEGRTLPLTLDLKLSPAFDVGGTYPNELLLVARVDDTSSKAVLKAATAHTGGASAGIAYFAYHRSLDVAASTAGEPVLAHHASVLLLPGSNLPAKKGDTVAPFTSLVLLDRADTRVYDLRGGSAADPIAVAVRPQRFRALLTELVGKPRVDDSSSVGFARIVSERPVDAPLGRPAGSTFTVATMAAAFTLEPAGPSATATPVGVPLRAAYATDGAVASSKMSLVGDPTQPAQPDPQVLYGPPGQFPSGRWSEGANSPTTADCAKKELNVFLDALKPIAIKLAACLVAGALSSIPCNVLYLGCLAAAAGVCAGIAASAMAAVVHDFGDALAACTIRVAAPVVN